MQAFDARRVRPEATASTWTFGTRDTVTVPPPIKAAFHLSPQERDDLLRFLFTSQALEGIEVPPDEAERILEEVLREPPPDIR